MIFVNGGHDGLERQTQPKQSYQQQWTLLQKNKKICAWRMTDCSSGTIWYWNDRLHVCMLGVCVAFSCFWAKKCCCSEHFFFFMFLRLELTSGRVTMLTVIAARGRRSLKKKAMLLFWRLLCGLQEHTLEYTTPNEFVLHWDDNEKFTTQQMGWTGPCSLTHLINVTTAWTVKTT